MRKYNWVSFLLILGFAFSCGKPLPELKGITAESWKEDKNGCLGKRALMADAIKTEKDKLLALNEMQIVELLGRPDQNELYKRNQKFFYYYITAAPSCSETKRYTWLSIRFNAMGLAKEVSVEEVG